VLWYKYIVWRKVANGGEKSISCALSNSVFEPAAKCFTLPALYMADGGRLLA
jgi:hypothetical protein